MTRAENNIYIYNYIYIHNIILANANITPGCLQGDWAKIPKGELVEKSPGSSSVLLWLIFITPLLIS